jgi:hypothetical protein
MTAKTLWLVSALLLMHSGRVDAQVGPVRHGFWMDVALGDGLAHMSSDTTPSQTRNGVDFILDLGWTFGSRVRAGVGVGQWTSRWGAGKQTWLTSYGVSAYYYPVAHRTAFLEVAAGGSYYARVHVPWQFLGADRADTTYLSGTAWGATVAAGWDARLGKHVSLRPRFAYSYGAPRNVHAADGTLLATRWKHDLLAIDVGLVFHPADSW